MDRGAQERGLCPRWFVLVLGCSCRLLSDGRRSCFIYLIKSMGWLLGTVRAPWCGSDGQRGWIMRVYFFVTCLLCSVLRHQETMRKVSGLRVKARMPGFPDMTLYQEQVAASAQAPRIERGRGTMGWWPRASRSAPGCFGFFIG